MYKLKILPVFIPFAGCGNRCIFCDQKAITGTSDNLDIIASARIQIEKWLERSSDWDSAAFYGGNFGALSDSLRYKLYKIIKEYKIKNIRFSTRPDTITNALISELKENDVNIVELGVQSLDNEVLRLNGRPYGKDDVFSAINKLVTVTDCGVQLMTGMYGQNLESSVSDALILSEMKIKTVRIYPTQVLKNTPLAGIFKEGRYNPPSLSETIAVLCAMYILFISSDINVIRMGLPEDAENNGQVVAGVRHECMGELVKTLAALLFFHTGGICGFSGYKGVVKKIFKDNFSKEINIDFKEICKKLKGYIIENIGRLSKGAAAHYAKIIAGETDYR